MAMQSDQTGFDPKPERGTALCPSAPPDWPDASLIGIAAGTAARPQVRYTGPRPISADLLALAGPVTPTEVFRFAARCQEKSCRYFDGAHCALVAAVVRTMTHDSAEAAGDIPRCGIRPRCRWWREQGVKACRRCAQIVTDNPAIDASLQASLSEIVR